MTALVARIRPHGTAVAGALAEAAGWAVRQAARLLPGVPGVMGPLLISYGLYEAWRPLGFIAAGVFLLWLDRRV